MHLTYLFGILALTITVLCLSSSYGKSIMLQKVIKDSKDIEKIKKDDVAPPKHLDGFKLGRDGSINSNFHKEVFLGEDVENFQNGNYKLKVQKQRLENIFGLIDGNNDKFVDVSELSNWVLLKTKEHFDEARHGNEDQFNKLDTNHDHVLTWNEYMVEFLGNKNFDRDEVARKLANKTKIDVSSKLKDEIDDVRDKWLEVADMVKPNQLNESQFLNFQHPELSNSMLELLISDFLHDLDTDGNRELTMHEFMAISSDLNADTIGDEWAARRRDEFKDIIDLNHDGVATKDEIEKYLDPLSESMAEQEARQLISFGDDDGNGKLSLEELLENSEFYTGSKLYNYARSVHEEF